MTDLVRVLVVGDAGVPASSLRPAGARGPRIRAVGPVAPAAAAVSVSTDPPDAVLIRALPSGEVAAVLRDVRRADAQVPILVQAGPDADDLLSSVLSAGGCGVLGPDATDAATREAILRARAGELVLDDEELRSLVLELAAGRARRSTMTATLTTREREVLSEIANGLDTPEISRRLGIAPATVQSHVKSVLSKLGVHSKVEAVRIAWRDGLVAVPA